MFQLLCVLKSGWDDEVPNDISCRWNAFMKELEYVKLIRVPRYVAVGQLSELDDVELHGFSDSSQIAYSAVIYVRFKVNGAYFLKLLASKTKVAPLMKTSIPRLELLACLLLTKLMNTVKTSLLPR